MASNFNITNATQRAYLIGNLQASKREYQKTTKGKQTYADV